LEIDLIGELAEAGSILRIGPPVFKFGAEVIEIVFVDQADDFWLRASSHGLPTNRMAMIKNFSISL
jgi:hypothetical protein